jgi:hypothetical protein
MNAASWRTVLAPAVLLGLALAVPGTSRADTPPATEAEREASGTAAAVPAVHADDLTPLTPETTFPRFTPEELRASGFPDHMHAFAWSDWRPPADAEGLSYGPGSLCRDRQVLPRADLLAEPGRTVFEPFVLHYNPGYQPCDLMIFVEFCDWGRVLCRDLLQLEADGTLTIVNPDNVQAYREGSGQGTWRTYALAADSCFVQPIPVLLGRTLVGHAAVDMVTQWTLRNRLGAEPPAWLVQGLGAYIGDMGVHLVNYMNQFRIEGPVLMRPAEVEAVLAAPPDPDPGLDRMRYRMARYSSFLMVWALVEEEGGLEPLRRLLSGMALGEDADEACRAAYGVPLAALVARLDPVVRGEPIGDATQSRSPHKPPEG